MLLLVTSLKNRTNLTTRRPTLFCSSAACRAKADISAALTGVKSGLTAPQCPLPVGLWEWRWQAENQEAALGPCECPVSGADDCPSPTLFPQTQ